jgi:hypothetical protein
MAHVLAAGKPSQRIMALKRYKELFRTQRDRFREHLNILEKQREVITKGNTEALLSYMEIEEHIVKDIFNIQKAIEPLEILCSDLAVSDDMDKKTAATEEEAEIAVLKAALERLKQETAVNAARNRDLLAKRIMKIRSEINSLRGNPYAERRSIYADNGAPSMIDIKS